MFEKHRIGLPELLILVLLLFGVLANVSIANAQDAKPVPPGSRQGECEPVPNCDRQTEAQISANVNRSPTTAQSESRAVQTTQATAERPGGSIEKANAIGQKLIPTGNACFTFDNNVYWNGSRWTFSYAGWGLQVDENPALNYKLKHLTYERQDSVGDGHSLKMGMDKPAHGLIVSPEFKANVGDKVTAVAYYYINPTAGPGQTQSNRQWATLHVKPSRATLADYTPSPIPGYYLSGWYKMTNELTMNSDGTYQVVLQGLNDSVRLSEVYFDNVEIWVNGEPRKKCLFAD